MSRAESIVVTSNAWLTSDPEVREDEKKTTEDNLSIFYYLSKAVYS